MAVGKILELPFIWEFLLEGLKFCFFIASAVLLGMWVNKNAYAKELNDLRAEIRSLNEKVIDKRSEDDRKRDRFLESIVERLVKSNEAHKDNMRKLDNMLGLKGELWKEYLSD